MRRLALAVSIVLFLAAPAQANQFCSSMIKYCPDGSVIAPIGEKCEYPPCGGYPPPADPWAPPPGATGHYTPPAHMFKKQPDQTQQPAGAACNKETFVCPDGTTVGRVPPMCNFARCPVVSAPPEDPAEETVEEPVEGEEPAEDGEMPEETPEEPAE